MNALKKPTINTSQRTQKFLKLKPRPFNVYVQFGKAKRRKLKGRVIVNPLQGLRNTRDKVVQQRILEDVGVSKPKFLATYQEAEQFLTKNPNKSILAKRVNHSRGRGMYRIDDVEALHNANPQVRDSDRYYFEEFVECNREWRIHVSAHQDEPVMAMRKCLRQEVLDDWREDKKNKEKPFIRNVETCYYKLDSDGDRRKETFPKMVVDCINAVKALGMDIAGIDIGENTKTNTWYIYEVNSACGMEEETRARYEKAIEHIIDVKAKKKGLL